MTAAGDEDDAGLLRYNTPPVWCAQALDLPEDHYRRAGVTRLHGHDRLNVDALRPGDLVFVKTDGMEVFAQVLPRIRVPIGLVTGVSDITPYRHAALAQDERVVSWSGTNLPLWSDRIMQIPIGFSERERPHGSRAAILAAAGGRPWEERDVEVLLTAMADTSPERRAIAQDGVTVCAERLAYPDYLALLGRARFVICPPGNGPDTLRVWETLATGGIPVVKSGPLDPLYAAHGCLIVPDWTEIPRCVRSRTDGPALRALAVESFRTRTGPFFAAHWRECVLRHHARLMAQRTG
ncbi:hypothetical protein [Azospirillum halopraeferens]|uniref:hypothetical protein n=1 Tax=Azospirillum halopraeferens TaxID=34010 RepID=UPI0004061512|nr:hypothetical protein [Azospirillum halopraeferens]